ncbi:MAG: transposase [Candidatus Acidiferrales bacterium]
MESVRYVGWDVHQETTSAAVLDSEGRVVMEVTMATRASAILDFVRGLRGTVYLTFEEGTYSAWLYDLLVGRVARLVVCNPRKNALLKAGNKNDAIDARKLARLLRGGELSAVYHGEHGLTAVQELGRSYTTLTADTTRVMGRLKAVFRGRAIATAGKKLYRPRHRGQWLAQLSEPGLRRRAELLYQQLDALQVLRHQARQELIVESRQHEVVKRLRTIPFLGPIRAAVLLGRVQTPHRFRTKRQFWTYCGLALETRSSADHRIHQGAVVRSRKPVLIRGLNWNHNHELKNLFKGAATTASMREGPFRTFYQGLLDKGMVPAMARLTLARKIAAITLSIWKKGDAFDAEHLKPKAA